MQSAAPTGELADIVRAVVEPSGVALVSLASERVSGRFVVHVVLHRRDGGVDLESLATFHRALQPRLEAVLGDDVRVEFSSPGITRRFRSFHEFECFVGSAVEIHSERGERIVGTITGADGSRATVATATGSVTLDAHDVRSAHLTDKGDQWQSD